MSNCAFIYMMALAIFLIIPEPAVADAHTSPVGEWKVADGTAHVRIMDCSKKLWGIISWVETPGTDSNNPDPTKQDRPILGMPILLAMHSNDDGHWKGDIYNSDNGKTYSGSINLESNDILHVKGCLLGNFLCGGEDWARLDEKSSSKTTNFQCPD